MDARSLVVTMLRWFAQNARDLPWRRTSDPYAIWVSEIMLQQTQVKTVLRYWDRWMRALPDIEALAKASSEKIHKLWEGLGYYSRVRNMQQAARVIVEKHGGKFPMNFANVLELPGIGRYTAGAICSIAFDQPTPILDGNAMRVLTRLLGITANPHEKKTNAQLWQIAERLVREAANMPARNRNRLSGNFDYEDDEHGKRNHASRITHHASRPCSQFNQALMELGALICTPKRPQCGICPVLHYCAAHRTGRVEQIPKLSKRVRSTERRFVAFVARKRGKFLVRQRPVGVINARLWEFPNIELAPGDGNLKKAARTVLGSVSDSLDLLCTIKHSITRYRITLQVFEIGGSRVLPAKGRWLNRRQLRLLPFSSAHKKILQQL